jgi:glycosyltransferase involved in cell wall biosynthesis
MYTTIESPRMTPDNDGYVLSIGRTLRDVDTLLHAAKQIIAPIRLVVGREDKLPAALPSNVQVFREIPLDQGHEMLRRAAVVAIPLLPTERATGQVVLFEALALGKPVVATRCAGTEDYLRDGENGLLVESGDAQALADAIRRLLQNPALAEQLATNALADCTARWMPDHHAGRKLAAIASLWLESPAHEEGPHA